MKYQLVADVVAELYSCATCVKGVYGVWTTLLKSFNFATFKEPNPHSFWALGLILVWKEAEFCDLQSYRQFFFRFLRKSRHFEFKFLGKNAFKKSYDAKNEMDFEKITLYRFVEHKIPLRLI